MNAKSARDDEYDEDLDDEDDADEDEDFDDADDDDEDDDEDFDDEDFDEEDDEDDEDPTWWAPHAVLGVLLVVGLFGFFGAFNQWLGFLAPPLPEGEPHGQPTSHAEAAPPPAPKPAHSAQRPPAGPRYGAKHLLVSYQGARKAGQKITRTKEEAKARAAEAAKKAKKGEKFEALVKEYSDEPGAAARGGNLGRWRKGAMVPQFQDAVDKMKVGDISDPVETPFGFHVIQRTH